MSDADIDIDRLVGLATDVAAFRRDLAADVLQLLLTVVAENVITSDEGREV